MKTDSLALFGGEKIIQQPFKLYNSIGQEEVEAAKSVVESGILSKFLGCWDNDFYGGEKGREFESESAAFFGIKHAVTFNSLTSGLTAAVGAIGIEPGDEIIVVVTPGVISDQIVLEGKPEFEVLNEVQFVPSNFTIPPVFVPIHLAPLSSMAIASTSLLGKPELEVLNIVQFVPSNFANPPPVPIHIIPLVSKANE